MINNAVTVEMLTAALSKYSAAAQHRNIYRGKSLGSSVTDAQKAAIVDGSFDDLYVGDYWTIDGTDWVIADMDYFYNTGSTALTKHHLVMLPRKPLYNAEMNTAGNTTGGYANSDMRTSGLNKAKTAITNAFGSMVLTHKEYLCNAVTDGHPSGTTQVDCTVELLSEIMVYGCSIYGSVANDGVTLPSVYTYNKTQLALFRLNPQFINVRDYVWLRDVVSAFFFAIVNYYGFANCNLANVAYGVLPYFLIG